MKTKEIKFYDDTLLGVKDDNGEVWLAVKKTCLDIGLTIKQADRQIQNIKDSLLFNGKNLKFEVVQKEGNREVKREVVCIHEKFVPMWLAQISLTPKMQRENSKAVEKLLKYQLEAADVLHKAFYETEEQKEFFHESLGLEGEIVDLKECVINLQKSLDNVVDNMTLNTYQQSKILEAGKKRVSSLLGSAHSKDYKDNSRLYFSNLWGNLRRIFKCASYKDLNPKNFSSALDWINNWNYVEN